MNNILEYINNNNVLCAFLVVILLFGGAFFITTIDNIYGSEQRTFNKSTKYADMLAKKRLNSHKKRFEKGRLEIRSLQRYVTPENKVVFLIILLYDKVEEKNIYIYDTGSVATAVITDAISPISFKNN